mgnify:CR=1 FL=1
MFQCLPHKMAWSIIQNVSFKVVDLCEKAVNNEFMITKQLLAAEKLKVFFSRCFDDIDANVFKTERNCPSWKYYLLH